jgi:hypothetical protein
MFKMTKQPDPIIGSELTRETVDLAPIWHPISALMVFAEKHEIKVGVA